MQSAFITNTMVTKVTIVQQIDYSWFAVYIQNKTLYINSKKAADFFKPSGLQLPLGSLKKINVRKKFLDGKFSVGSSRFLGYNKETGGWQSCHQR